MTEHTPGPWTFREVPEDMGPVEFWVDGLNAIPVADIKVNGHTQANARLIAAAPDLLGLVESMYHRRIHEAPTKFTRKALTKWRNDARAAIAKARNTEE